MGDFNGDGFMDLAVVSVGTPLSNTADDGSSEMMVLLGKGDGTFRDALLYGAGPGDFIAVPDVNGDHKPHTVLTGSTIWVLLNTYVPGAGGNSVCTAFAPTGN